MKNKVIKAKKILVGSNVSTAVSNEFPWLPNFILEVYILILNLRSSETQPINLCGVIGKGQGATIFVIIFFNIAQ